MADVENEVLDWENEDDEQQHQNGGARSQDSFDDDADDAVSLGDEEELPVYPQGVPVEPVSLKNPPRDQHIRSSSRERGAMTTSRPSSRNVDPPSGDRYDRESSGPRQRARRGSSPRRRAPPPVSARITHALPPKPVLSAVAPSPSTGRATSMKGAQNRPPGSDTISANDMSPESPTPHSTSWLDWETRVSSKGDTYYYNRVTFESTWEAPSEYRPLPSNGRDSFSSDGLQERQNVPTHSFRSSSSQSDMASQDPPPRRHQPEDSARPSRNARSDPISEEDRYYRPKETGKRGEDRSEDSYPRDSRRERAAAQSASGTQSRSRAKARSPSPPSQESYYRDRPRDHERSSNRDPEPSQRDRIGVTNSAPHEQRGRPRGDSGRVSRQADMDTYIPSEDRTRPSAPRRQSSPPRHPRAESPERLSRNQPISAPRRRPSPPPPLLPPPPPVSAPVPSNNSRSNDRRPAEPSRTSSNSVPLGPKSRDRGEPIVVSLPTGPAASKFPRFTDPRSEYVELVYPDQPHYTRVRSVQASRGQQVPENRERSSGNSAPPAREAAQPPRKSVIDREPYPISKEPSRSQESRVNDQRAPPPASGDDRSRDPHSRRTSVTLRQNDSRPIERDEDSDHRYNSRSPDWPFPPRGPELEHILKEHRARIALKRERRAALEARRRAAGPGGGSASRNQDAELEDLYASRSSRGREPPPPPPPAEPARNNSYRGEPEVERESRRDAVPSSDRERERGREQRREPSPKKNGRRESTRKMVSGTNNTPLGTGSGGRNRFSAPPPPVQNSGHGPSISPEQRVKPLPPANNYDYDYPERSRDPVIDNRRESYDRPPDVPRYPERSREPRYESPPRTSRRASPPPQDYASRVNDPHSMPPHMINAGRERAPRGEPRPRSRTRRDRGRDRTPSPPRRGLPTQSSSMPNLPPKPRPPTPIDTRPERQSGSWHSDVGRRGSDAMVIDNDRYTPPTDRLKDSLRVSSHGSSSRDPPPVKILHPSLPPPPIVHPLPQKPVLDTRREQQQPPPAHSESHLSSSSASGPNHSASWDDRSDRRRSNSRWDAPQPATENSTTASSPDVDMGGSQPVPVSPSTSKKMISNEITPPRLRRPDPERRMPVDQPSQGSSGASGSGYGGSRRELDQDVRRDREGDWEGDREGDRGHRERGGGDERNDHLAAPPMSRSNSLLERLTDPLPPSLRERVTVPLKRDRDEMGSGGGGGGGGGDGRFDPSYDLDDVHEAGSKRRRKGGGGRSRRAGNAKRHP